MISSLFIIIILTYTHLLTTPASPFFILLINNPVEPFCEYRVRQKNLVYCTNISLKYSNEALLKSGNFFGQFGKIEKIVITKKSNLYEKNLNLYDNNEFNSENNIFDSCFDPQCSVYVTYSDENSAAKCISEINESLLDNKVINATYGTTKFCKYFLNKTDCSNINCVFLHEKVDEEDLIKKENLLKKDFKMHNLTSKFKNKERLGEDRKFNLILKLISRYKSQRTFKIPKEIKFVPKYFK